MSEGINIQVPIEELRKNKLMVATPMYGGQCMGTFSRAMMDLSSLCTQYGVQLNVYFLFNESLITRARNYCCDVFMRSDCTHLMFVDSDIGFNPNDVIALMALSAMEDSPYDVIGGPYPKKTISWEKIKRAVDKGVADKDPNVLEKFVGDYVFNPKGGSGNIPINKPVEVLEIGTGFMMVRRNTLEKFRNAYPHYMYRPDHVRTADFDGSREIMQYFQAEIDTLDYTKFYQDELAKLVKKRVNDPDIFASEVERIKSEAEELASKRSKRYLSEDYWFCQKIQELGMQTWFCPWMSMTHTGTYVFGGSLADLASIGASATANPTELRSKSNTNKKKKR